MLQTVCLLEASAKKSAAREALVYFEEHFQAAPYGTCNTSNISTANRMQVEAGGPRGNPLILTLTLWQRLACLSLGFRESLRYIEAKSRQSRHGKVLFFSSACRRKADW